MNTLFISGNMDVLESIILLLSGGLILRFSLTITGQAWAKTYQQTVAFMLLPVITFVITKTITGNIALSLGMIGAMSIVRFRNPVKSALELVMYFALITIGISASVRTRWAVLLILVTVGIIFGIKIIQRIYKKFNKSFYNTSFNEGINYNLIEVHSNKKIDIIESNENLKNIINIGDKNEFIYRLSFENKKELQKLKEEIEKLENIKKIDVNYI